MLPWMLAGLVGGEGVLAGRWRSCCYVGAGPQFRARRPGRTIATLEPVLVPVEDRDRDQVNDRDPLSTLTPRSDGWRSHTPVLGKRCPRVRPSR